MSFITKSYLIYFVFISFSCIFFTLCFVIELKITEIQDSDISINETNNSKRKEKQEHKKRKNRMHDHWILLQYRKTNDQTYTTNVFWTIITTTATTTTPKIRWNRIINTKNIFIAKECLTLSFENVHSTRAFEMLQVESNSKEK